MAATEGLLRSQTKSKSSIDWMARDCIPQTIAFAPEENSGISEALFFTVASPELPFASGPPWADNFDDDPFRETDGDAYNITHNSAILERKLKGERRIAQQEGHIGRSLPLALLGVHLWSPEHGISSGSAWGTVGRLSESQQINWLALGSERGVAK